MVGVFPPGLFKQQPPQFIFYLAIIQGNGFLFGQNNQVPDRQFPFMAAKEFPEQALHPIASGRFAQAPGHHQSQPGNRGGRRCHNDPEMAPIKPLALGLRPEKIGALAEPVRFGITGGPLGGWGQDGGGTPVRGIRRMAQGHPPVTPRGVSGPWPDVASRPGGHPRCSCVPENRGFGPVANCVADTCVSCHYP